MDALRKEENHTIDDIYALPEQELKTEIALKKSHNE